MVKHAGLHAATRPLLGDVPRPPPRPPRVLGVWPAHLPIHPPAHPPESASPLCDIPSGCCFFTGP